MDRRTLFKTLPLFSAAVAAPAIAQVNLWPANDADTEARINYHLESLKLLLQASDPRINELFVKRRTDPNAECSFMLCAFRNSEA